MSSTAPRPSERLSPSASSIRSPALARIAPFAVFLAFLAVQPLVEPHFDGRWLAVWRGIAAGAVLAFFWRHYTELRDRPAMRAGDWALAIGVGVAVFIAWIH